jgi:cation transporter-like permease
LYTGTASSSTKAAGVIMKLWKPIAASLGLAAACAACCALPSIGFLIGGALTGTAFASAGLYLMGWIAGIVIAVLIAAGLVIAARRARPKPQHCAMPSDACGCAAPQAPGPTVEDATTARVACTLGARRPSKLGEQF